MYEEELYDRELLNSAMDALDRLGKEYDVCKRWKTETNDQATAAFTGKKERKVRYWVIKEI